MPAGVPAGKGQSTIAVPFVTGTLIAVPITVAPFKMVNVAVPSVTVAPGVVTLALSCTIWRLELNVADWLAAAVVVAVGPSVVTPTVK